MWYKLRWFNWLWQFSCEGFLPLIKKYSVTHMQVLAAYVKEGLNLASGLSLENSKGSYLSFWMAWLHSMSCFFFSIDAISSNIGEVFLINPSANVFVYGDFSVHYKGSLTYSGGTERPGKHYYSFFLSDMTLLRRLTFLPNKVNLLYLLYLIRSKFCLLHLIKKNCLLKAFLGTLILIRLRYFFKFLF